MTRSALSGYPASHSAGVAAQPGLQVGAEPGPVGGDADLGAERRAAAARTRPGLSSWSAQFAYACATGHGDVAGPQFLGQVGQHARLQVPAHEHPRVLAVPDGPPPVLRGERHVQHPRDRPPGLIDGQLPGRVGDGDLVADVVAGQRRVLPHEVQGVQHAAIGAGRLQVQGAGHGEHRRPVLAEMPGHQRGVVVAVVGRAPGRCRRTARRTRPRPRTASRAASSAASCWAPAGPSGSMRSSTAR